MIFAKKEENTFCPNFLSLQLSVSVIFSFNYFVILSLLIMVGPFFSLVLTSMTILIIIMYYRVTIIITAAIINQVSIHFFPIEPRLN